VSPGLSLSLGPGRPVHFRERFLDAFQFGLKRFAVFLKAFNPLGPGRESSPKAAFTTAAAAAIASAMAMSLVMATVARAETRSRVVFTTHSRYLPS
jgi:hypothetical protein